MSETWTPITAESESWTSEVPGRHTFSTLVFSHDTFNGLSVYSLKSADGKAEVWGNVTADAETWVAV